MVSYLKAVILVQSEILFLHCYDIIIVFVILVEVKTTKPYYQNIIRELDFLNKIKYTMYICCLHIVIFIIQRISISVNLG